MTTKLFAALTETDQAAVRTHLAKQGAAKKEALTAAPKHERDTPMNEPKEVLTETDRRMALIQKYLATHPNERDPKTDIGPERNEYGDALFHLSEVISAEQPDQRIQDIRLSFKAEFPKLFLAAFCSEPIRAGTNAVEFELANLSGKDVKQAAKIAAQRSPRNVTILLERKGKK